MEMVEIYNESIRDLLSAVDHREALASSSGSNGSNGSSHKGLEVRQWAGREGEDDQAIPGVTSVRSPPHPTSTPQSHSQPTQP